MRELIDLAGVWEHAVESDAGPWSPMELPANWYLRGLEHTGRVWFRRRLTIPPAWAGRRVTLRFGAVDYHARAWLDGALLGGHTGGFAPFAFVVAAAAGDHDLLVEVDCPEEPFGTVWPHTKTTIRGVHGHHDCRPGNWTERGQERSSGGIWGSLSLVADDAASIEAFGFATTLRGADADCEARVRVGLWDGAGTRATVRLRLGEEYELLTETVLQPGLNEVAVGGVLATPTLWWTHEHGEPHLYACQVTVEVAGEVVALHTAAVGIREITIDAGWTWRLNGRPVFVRGMNYIGSQWSAEITPEWADRDVALARDAHLNCLRVHAHVTAPAFYDACDRHGVLVWQDLPLQWGYADTPETYRVTRQMVRDVIDLHGWRPSIAMWAAHNEAPWNEPWLAAEAGGFTPDQNQRLDHELAALFRELDPSRFALANSGSGDGHTYPGWYWGDWRAFTELPGGALISEYGAQAVPNLASLRRFLPEGATADDWSFHGFQHSENEQRAGLTFDMPAEELVAASQHYQARLLQFGTEWYRRRKRERVQGVIPFMLVDPWPSISWSVLDYWREPKLGYSALQRAMQPVLPSIEAGDDSYGTDDAAFGIWWINDLHRAFPRARLEWALADAAGTRLAGAAQEVHVFADGARRIMQAGPFELEPGSYTIRSWLQDEHGESLGSNEWRFSVGAGDGHDHG